MTFIIYSFALVKKRKTMNFKDAIVIDVRTEGEFSGGNVKGSINIPMDSILSRLDEIKQIKGNIVFCCASGGRSNAVCEHLKNLGIQNVHNGGSWSIVAMQLQNQ